MYQEQIGTHISTFYRIYQCIYVPEERLTVHFNVEILNNSGMMIDMEFLMKQDNEKPVITPKEVMSWFPKSFLEITVLEVGSLVQKLNLMRVTKPIGKAASLKPMEDIFNFLRILSDQLPIGLQEINRKIEQSNPIMQDAINEGNDLLQHLQAIQKEITLLKNKGFLVQAKSHLKFWHIDAVIIARQISTYGRFHGKELSFKQANSKLIQIVKLALERANIVHVSEQTIVQALNRFTTEKQMSNRMQYIPDVN